ncbi:MAG: hypothetical protein KDC02_25835, partial [Flavobacteriales bacterium]|nr:hypothetical protein [Flavobacteriales bacterium]
MMRFACTALLGLSLLQGGLAQPYGNEWIVPGRQYWKFSVGSEGILRIDSTSLANSGFPVTVVDPREIQLFAREKQVPIYLEGEQDGVFNTADFIEFKADPNDGWLDRGMWDDPANQNNPYYSLINDTIFYYLTWDAEPQSLRIMPFTDTDYGGHMPRTWFIGEGLRSVTQRYQRGWRDNNGATNSFLVEGEGFFNGAETVANGADQIGNFNVPTRLPYQQADAPDAQCRVVWAGVNN